MNNVALAITVRLVHIVSGVLWVGSATMLAAYVLPAARSSDDGLRFLRELIWVRNLPRFLNVVLVLTLLSGLTLYGNLVFLTHGAWAKSRHGIVLGVGGTSAILAAAVATLLAAPAIHQALALAEKGIPSDGGVPGNPLAVSRALRRYAIAMWVVVALLLVAASLMAISRYY
ncbi:MAG TPA: hypothetical protein VJW73_21765 [Gemmatimonadaceae bacterium]|nr:hypothetical protein [Gemmatimonadaceae bacterium]